MHTHDAHHHFFGTPLHEMQISATSRSQVRPQMTRDYNALNDDSHNTNAGSHT